jgi:addiction module RelE/StbE family toxin
MHIVFHTSFKKKFKKLSLKIQEHFYKRLVLFQKNKFDAMLNNHSVEKRFPHCRSINITGDYRAIFKEGKKDVCTFINIGTHSELY